MKSVWLNGWAIGEVRLRQMVSDCLGDIDVSCINPNPSWEAELEKCIGSNTTVVGYSMGAFLLLSRLDFIKSAKRVVLFAPFLDFKHEANMGGRVRLTQLKKLSRWLKTDPESALADFYQRAGFQSVQLEQLPAFRDDLIWGVDQLMSRSVPASRLVECESYIGDRDTLLDASILKNLYPDINVVAEAGHDLGELLEKSRVAL